jgi:hypothetical protein
MSNAHANAVSLASVPYRRPLTIESVLSAATADEADRRLGALLETCGFQPFGDSVGVQCRTGSARLTASEPTKQGAVTAMHPVPIGDTRLEAKEPVAACDVREGKEEGGDA